MPAIVELASRVRNYWLAQGLEVAVVRYQDVLAAEKALGYPLPPDYRDFLSVAGLPYRDDKEGFLFWPLMDLAPAYDVLLNAGSGEIEDKTAIVFADYLQECWWYQIWISGPLTGKVSLVLGTDDNSDPQAPIGTFSEFLEAYLVDSELLYPAD